MVGCSKIRPTDCNTGQLRRVFTCCTIDDDDETMYTGTATGDVLQIGLARCAHPLIDLCNSNECCAQLLDAQCGTKDPIFKGSHFYFAGLLP